MLILEKVLHVTFLLSRVLIYMYAFRIMSQLLFINMSAGQMVQWLGKPATVPEVPGSNPG